MKHQSDSLRQRSKLGGEKGIYMRTLYVTDLDGTLLNKKHRVTQRSANIINELVEKGMMFTYATARSLSSASVVTKGLAIKIPVITYNGTFITHPLTNQILSSLSFVPEESEEVIHFLEEHSISPLVYAYINRREQVSWVTSRENQGIKHYLSLRKQDKRLRPVKNKEELFLGNIFHFTCIGEKEELMPVYQFFSKDDRYHCIIFQELYRSEYWCEIMPKQATKKEAIIKLKDLCGCNKVISFGDSMNDIPMFEISDERYAVANAVEELKGLATGVIGSNEEDGVAKWLKEGFYKRQ